MEIWEVHTYLYYMYLAQARGRPNEYLPPTPTVEDDAGKEEESIIIRPKPMIPYLR